jgi:hypothetical protein
MNSSKWLKEIWNILALKKMINGLSVRTHTCNPSYLGGRDQDDHSSSPDWAKS